MCDQDVFGVYVCSFAIAWETASCATLTPADAYWFGDPGSLPDALWDSTTSPSMAGGDSAFAFSWQDRVVPPGRTLGFTVLLGAYYCFTCTSDSAN
jgi:hypothetical protein